jgi:DNA-binding transcriptional MerR regulator
MSATQADFVRAGITYRQLDYWTRTGVLRADNPHCGSGGVRTWPDEELRVAQRIAVLLRAGISLRTAATVARQTPGTVHIGPGIILQVAAS